MKKILAIACLATLAACGPQQHYEWGRYEDSLYAYYKDPSASDSYAMALAETVRKGDQSGRTPPGLHAEYGYQLLTQGRTAEALQEFATEKRLWPESGPFMDRVSASVSSKASSSPGPQAATLTGAGT